MEHTPSMSQLSPQPQNPADHMGTTASRQEYSLYVCNNSSSNHPGSRLSSSRPPAIKKSHHNQSRQTVEIPSDARLFVFQKQPFLKTRRPAGLSKSYST